MQLDAPTRARAHTFRQLRTGRGAAWRDKRRQGRRSSDTAKGGGRRTWTATPSTCSRAWSAAPTPWRSPSCRSRALRFSSSTSSSPCVRRASPPAASVPAAHTALNPSTAAEKRAAWSAKVEALVAEVEAAGDEEAATKLNSGPSAALAMLGAPDSYFSDGSCWAIGRKELRRSQVVCLPRFTKIQRGTFLRTVDWCGSSAAGGGSRSHPIERDGPIAVGPARKVLSTRLVLRSSDALCGSGPAAPARLRPRVIIRHSILQADRSM